MKTASVSVVIVNYKAYEELDACLNSLEADVNEGVAEAIVVDNGTAADSLAAVAARHPRVHFVPERENIGFARGVNEAARRASGDFLLLLNPDATVTPGAVERLRGFLAAHPDVAAVGGRVYDADGAVQRSARAFPSLRTGLFGRTSLLTALWPRNRFSRAQLVADEMTTTPKEVDWVAGAWTMIRSEAFRAIGGMDESFFLYWEDADLCRRLRDAGWRIMYEPGAAAMHAVGRSSRYARIRAIVAFHRSALRYHRKHSRGALAPVSVVVAAVALYSRMTIKVVAVCARRLFAAESSR